MTVTAPVLVADKDLADRIGECLNAIVDPCSIAAGAPAGLVDMGLVMTSEIEPRDEGGLRAVIAIGITHPFCMMAGVFLNEVRQRVGAIEGIEEIVVTLDSDTVWTPALMSDAYRARLDAVRSAKRIPQ